MNYKHFFPLLLLIVTFSFAVEMKYLNIAIIWNDQTYNSYVPYGWQVGSSVKGETSLAPEIGKAQLKRVLNSIDPSILIDSSNSSLDTVGIPDELRNGNGIPSGPYAGKLKNVRIYNVGTLNSFQQISSDFDGESLSSLIYLNSGAIYGDLNLYQIIREAIENEVGVMFIGSESATETQLIDTSRTYLPVMGVQKEFYINGYIGDNLKSFEFLTRNNTAEWDIADTVLLTGQIDYSDENKSIYLIIDESSGDTVFKKIGDYVQINRTVYPDGNFLTRYGEWSIKAKAVNVINVDYFQPEMGNGIHVNHGAIAVTTNEGSVKVAKADWGAPLIADTTIVFNRGEEISGIQGNYIDSVFTLTNDFVVEVSNVDKSALKDSILIMKSGDQINFANIDSEHDLFGGTYIGSYQASGYGNLKIDLMNTDKSVFGNVFPALHSKGISTLKFKPWTKGGRIKADADIWSFNEKLKLAEFDEIYDGIAAWDSSKYYCAYLGRQVAGFDGGKQFIKSKKNPGSGLNSYNSDFDLPFDSLLIDSLGYDSNGKQYYTIAVIQKKHQRSIFFGFQPSYLEDSQITQDLLSDGIKWISSYVLNHKLPKPKIFPEDSSIIELDLDTITVVADFFQKSEYIKKEGYNLIYTVDINSVEKKDTIVVPADDGSNEIDSFRISLSSMGFDKASFKAGDKVNIEVCLEPTNTESYVHGSSNAVFYSFKSDVSNHKFSLANNGYNIPISIGNLKYSIDMFDLMKNRSMEINLYNLSGRKIKMLYNGEMKELLNKNIGINSLSKGVYFLSFKGNISNKNIKILHK